MKSSREKKLYIIHKIWRLNPKTFQSSEAKIRGIRKDSKGIDIIIEEKNRRVGILAVKLKQWIFEEMLRNLSKSTIPYEFRRKGSNRSTFKRK